MAQNYSDKGDHYFGVARTEIEPLLPEGRLRVLEIGCGAGATLAWLRRGGRCSIACGIELSEQAAEAARVHAERVETGDAEQLIASAFPGEVFDLVLCLDVLEHMIDPWAFVRKLDRLLAPGGHLILSIPNVRNLRVLVPLVFRGRWRYEEFGLLDRTHLRFFTLEGALALAQTESLRVKSWRPHFPARSTRLGLLNRLSCGLLSNFVAIDYLIAAQRTAVQNADSASGAI